MKLKGAQLHNDGFTLIEMLIVVAIVGILVAIALPSYRDYVLRGYLVEATNTLSSTRSQLEQFYQDNRTYQTTGAFVSPCANLVNTSRFTYTCNNFTATTYTLTATGTGPTAGFVFTVTQDNAMATTSSAWPSSTGACWITKKGGTC